jgi:DNA mismatch repair protein MSH2
MELILGMQALLIQLGVKEVLLPADDKSTDYDLKKIRTLIERCNIVITDRKKSANPFSASRQTSSLTFSHAGEFAAKDVEQDLNRLLRGNLQASTRRAFLSLRTHASSHPCLPLRSRVRPQGCHGGDLGTHFVPRTHDR